MNHPAAKTSQTTKPNLDLSQSKKSTSVKEIKIKLQRDKIQARLKKLGLTGAFEGELDK